MLSEFISSLVLFFFAVRRSLSESEPCSLAYSLSIAANDNGWPNFRLRLISFWLSYLSSSSITHPNLKALLISSLLFQAVHEYSPPKWTHPPFFCRKYLVISCSSGPELNWVLPYVGLIVRSLNRFVKSCLSGWSNNVHPAMP